MTDFNKYEWEPSEQDNLGPISQSYSSITKELETLQKELKCPDNFIHDFLGAIKKEWEPLSCKLKAKSFKNKNI